LPLGGTLLGVTELHDADVPEPFLIAILGDGFTKEEDRQFLKFAHLIVSALRTTRPFSDNMAAIRVIAVRAASEESGITDCPHRGVPRNTFYGVRGYYPSPSRTPTGAGYVGMDNWEDLYLTADKAGVPVPDLFIMVANCAVYGGSGWPDRRMAFVCTGVIAYGPLVLGQAALHESGHAIADLADEYFGQCYAVWNEDWTGRFPNVVPASHAETASWYTPAIDVHAWDATGCSFPGCNGEHNEPGSAYTGIGLYYGGHFVESQPAVVPCDEWARGGEFHRSESECRMRYVDAPFCAVCAGEIEAVLLDTVGTPPQAP
jgi:hypothetical protein